MKMKENKVVITIDGPAGSGKSTVSRLLAKTLKYVYLDTGAMYRAVALSVSRNKVDLGDTNKLRDLCSTLDLSFSTDEFPPRLFLGHEDVSMSIRSPEMDMLSSKVSAIQEVRKAMTLLQRKMAKGANLVAEGRDMGTVVFKDARHKFFLSAPLDVRAERRYKERIERGESVSRNSVKSDLMQRDLQDQTRSLAPLKAAEDAEIIDSENLTPEQVMKMMFDRINYSNPEPKS
jgi:cytidylate kinase